MISGFNQVRFAHTDLPVPDFSAYRRDGTKAIKGSAQNSEARKAFTYMMLAGIFFTFSRAYFTFRNK